MSHSDRSPATESTRPASVDALARLVQQVDNCEEAEHIETHISQVLLTPEHAYKLKKPVAFDFCDFHTAARRRAACHDELRLNRRLAADVYLDVLPVFRDAASNLAFDGVGDPVDWVVKMRRLPDARRLDSLVRANKLDDDQLAALIARLVRFYRETNAAAISGEQLLTRMRAHILDNRRALLAANVPAEQVQRIHAFQLTVLTTRAEEFATRQAAGRIVDGHGDLRPEHVYLVDPPAVIDCLEFSAELRAIDIADELAFFAMECDALEAEDVGQRVLRQVLAALDDEVDPLLIAFYKSYRACVRAKVAELRAEQSDSDGAATEDAELHLQLADRYRSAAGFPPLLVVGGTMGTGKSTLATHLAEQLGWKILATDTIRRELLGPSPDQAGYNQQHYAPHARDRVYGALLERAESSLAAGVPVILDGSFIAADHTARVQGLAERANVAVRFVRCTCSAREAARRVAERNAEGESPSEARPELIAAQRAEQHEQDAHRALDWLEIETTAPLSTQAESVYRRSLG